MRINRANAEIGEVTLAQAYRLLNHGPTVIVSSYHNGKQNLMAAAWVTPLDFAPPKITIVIDKNTYTRELIEASGAFAINVPCVAQLDTVRKVGTSSGRNLNDTDKYRLYGLQTFLAKTIDAPLLKGCVAWLECRVIPEPHCQDTHDLFVAEVVAAYADERVFSKNENGQFGWHFEGYPGLRTIHHVASGTFFVTGEPVSATL
ncbi:MAG: flavin reductase [Betaproteobacteria bacterium HGW-Betaproteobacteria-22]|nr:MAG: flavin reductase [Betaproteobacteria bacterium HGW-Betaproteobacteria-22]